MITHVAIRSHGVRYSLPAPNRHHHILWVLSKRRGNEGAPEVADESLMAESLDPGENSQGFLDDQGNYLNRVDALAHALACNQVKDPNNIRAERLFSEDVW